MRFELPIILFAWGLLQSGCTPSEPRVVVCVQDADCPTGARCEEGVCQPGEFTPLPADASVLQPTDAGVDSGAQIVPIPDAGLGLDTGPVLDSGRVDAALRPLEILLERPAEGERVAGVVRLTGRVTTDPSLVLRDALFRLGDAELGEAGASVLQEGDGVYRIEQDWPSEAVDDGPYVISLAVSDSGQRSVQSEPRSFRVYNYPSRLQVEGERFVLEGRAWGMVSVAYVAEIELSGAALVADLQGVAQAGFNTLELEAPGDALEIAENVFDLGSCARLRELLDAAEQVGLRVLLRLPPLTAYPWLLEAHPAYGVSTAPYVDGKARSALARRHLNLVERCSLGQQASLVGYELLSGPRAGDLQGRLSSAAVAAWEAWSLNRHGDAEARDAAWGVSLPAECGEGAASTCPPPVAALCAGPGAVASPAAVDYREFMSSAAELAIIDLVERLRPLVGAKLLTVGHQTVALGAPSAAALACEGHGGYLDPRRGSAALDFVSLRARPWVGVPVAPQEGLAPVGYEEFAEDFSKLEFLALYARAGLPVVISGLGYDAQGVPEGEAVKQAVLARALDGAIYLGAAGVGVERWRSRGDGSDDGLMAADGELSAAVDALASRADALASPDLWEADVQVIAPTGRYVRFSDVVIEGVDRYVGPRRDGEKVGVIGCDDPPALESCELVLGCTDLCQED